MTISRRISALVSFTMVALFVSACDNGGERKIKLASGTHRTTDGTQKAASVLRVSPEEQRTVAVLFFNNGTGDASLDWLRRGLTDMLVTELSQSPYLNVVTMRRLTEVARRMGKAQKDLTDLSFAAMVARMAKAQTLLTGRFYRASDSLRIDVELRQVESGQVVRRETVAGSGLESIFSMVDDLSQRVRTNLRGDFEAIQASGVSLVDMTKSVEAFRCYSKGLEALDKLIYVQADSCFRKAVEYDTTFAVAYLRLARSSFAIGQYGAGQEALRMARRHVNNLSQSDRLQLRLLEADVRGDVKESLAIMEDIITRAPRDVDTRMALATMLLHRLGDHERAIEEYETVIELEPGRKLAYNQLAYLYAYRGDFTTALKYLDEYQQLAPDEPNPYDSRGEILMMAGRLQEAAAALQTALEKWPSFYPSSMRLAAIYSELGEEREALKYSSNWIDHAPSEKVRSDAYTQRAAILWRTGRIKEASEALRLAEKALPESSLPIIVGGEMYRAIGDTASALSLHRRYFRRMKTRVAKDFADAPEKKSHLLMLCLESGLPADEALRMAQALVGDEQRSLFREQFGLYLGVLYLRAGEVERGEAMLSDPDAEFYDVLTRLPGVGRSRVWKYLSEAIRLEPKTGGLDYRSCNLMLESAEKAGRKDLELLARFSRAQYYAKYDRRDDLAAEYRDLGTPMEKEWRVIGPFQNRSGFMRRFPPEDSVDLRASYVAMGRRVTWQPATDGAYDGFVDLRAVLKRSSWAVGYATVSIHVPDERMAQLRLATDEACKLWLNGKLVWQAFRSEDPVIDQDIVTVMLRPGENRLLLKVTNSIRDWGFYLRVTDEQGRGFPDIRFRPPAAGESSVVVL